MEINSHSLIAKDFKSSWYKKWAKQLKQDKDHLDGHALLANKFWQNAVMVEALYERGLIKNGCRGLGFGVGQERLPALFAKHKVFITATDQDFKTRKAGHWAKQELATGTQSLNSLRLCPSDLFNGMVEYMPVDMTKIPTKLQGKYDFLWSNCALGHLGSIPAGLKFIEDSLKCLKPGGWAVHTTEVNILSNNTTVEGGSTVIFRLKDLYRLQKKLTKLGYKVSPFQLNLGSSEQDFRLSMRPEFGNDYSKIQVMGNLATQLVLIIQKPLNQRAQLPRAIGRQVGIHASYLENLRSIHTYRTSEPNIKAILQSQRPTLSNLCIEPMRQTYKLNLTKGDIKTLYVGFKNCSKVPLFSLYNRLAANKPIALATDAPRDRNSIFKSSDWENPNRVCSKLWVRGGKTGYQEANYIKPGDDFWVKVTIDANKAAKGNYTETFSIVQEAVGWADNSQISLVITVT